MSKNNKENLLNKLILNSTQVLKNYYRLEKAFDFIEKENKKHIKQLKQCQEAIEIAKKTFAILIAPGHSDYSSTEMKHILGSLFACEQLDELNNYAQIKAENIILKNKIKDLEAELKNRFIILNDNWCLD